MDPDQQLMLRVRDGDKAAFEALYRRHARAVLNYVHRMLGARERAEEVTQDVFVKLYGARAGYEPSAKFTTYLYRIATNACLNERAKAEHQFASFSLDQALGDDPAGRRPELPDAEAAAADETLAREATARRIRAALERLTDTQRAALVMREYDDRSYEEIAGSLATTVPAVKGLIHRAREALREHLKDLETE